MSLNKRFGCSTFIISPALPFRASRVSVEDNNDMLQIRMLEEQLIDMKIALATSKSREDYLMLECHRLAKRVEDCEKENQELRGKLEDKHFEENETDDEVLSEEDHIPTVAVPTFRPANDSPAETTDEVVEIKKSRPPNCIGLAYIDKTKSVSMLSFNSSASNIIYEDDEADFSSPHEYSVPLCDEKPIKSEKVPIPHPASCASGLAFLSGNLRSSMLSVDEDLSLGLDDVSQQSSSLASGFFI
mmetsp:Transcript_12433/g.26257  ORF Transcript_12433/g.26257 Transcript_12433/m.26257 type:complete len:244 (-) Transcript_12433:174-905(-)